MSIIDALVQHQAAATRGEARRLIAQGAVRIGTRVIDTYTHVVTDGDHVRVGKTRTFTVGRSAETPSSVIVSTH